MGVGCLTRTPYGEYPEYHTSGDNPAFVEPDAMADTLQTVWEIFGVLERNRNYVNLNPHGEPQLGNRGYTTRSVGEVTRNKPNWRCCGCSTCPIASTACCR